jgi:predicted nucleic-acid-binding Zn-ribbon protein
MADEADKGFSSEVLRYFRNALSKAKCPICGGTSWRVGQDDDIAAAIAVGPKSISGVLSPKFLSAVWAICSTCGYIALFTRSIVDKWLKENPPDSPDVNDAG